MNISGLYLCAPEPGVWVSLPSMASLWIRGALHLQMSTESLPERRRLFSFPSPGEDHLPLFYVPLQHPLLRTQRLRVSRAYLEAAQALRLPVRTLK